MESDQRNRRNRSRLALLSLMIALVLLVSALPLAPAAAQDCKVKHTVEAGDTIQYLANLYSVGWEQIVNANDLLPPYTITVDQVLCIPGASQPSTTSTKTPAKGKEPTLDVVPQISHVYVSVENFAPKTSYFVRVFPRNNTVSYRIGVFTTNKEGDFADWFKIPGFVPRTPNMGVCVKNAWTDAVSCVKYEEPWAAAGIYLARTCQKEGR